MSEIGTIRTEADVMRDITELASVVLRRVQRGSDIPPRLLDITDAGRYLAMSDKAVRQLIAEGQLPYLQRVPGRSPYLLDIQDLNSWVLRNKIHPSQP